ncbi:MAG TPA: hypothetical protein VFZ47_11470 [Chitinophagaceae bacterium]
MWHFKRAFFLKKGIFVVAILASFTACISDRITLITRNFKPNTNPQLRFDGFYTRKEKPFELYAAKRWEAPITPKFFFSNGSVVNFPTHQNEQQLQETLTKYHNKVRGDWGAYQIRNDTLITEILHPGEGIILKERLINYFIIKRDTLFLFQWIDRKGKITKSTDTLYFRPFAVVPDVDKGYIR